MYHLGEQPSNIRAKRYYIIITMYINVLKLVCLLHNDFLVTIFTFLISLPKEKTKQF